MYFHLLSVMQNFEDSKPTGYGFVVVLFLLISGSESII